MKDKDKFTRDAGELEKEAMRLHTFYKGKIKTIPKCVVRNLKDFSIWYTPGVAAPCRSIHKNRERDTKY